MQWWLEVCGIRRPIVRLTVKLLRSNSMGLPAEFVGTSKTFGWHHIYLPPSKQFISAQGRKADAMS